MKKKRKISRFVRKVSLSEAEKIDHDFWSKASEEDRLKELESLRKIQWGNTTKRIEKLVIKRKQYEEK